MYGIHRDFILLLEDTYMKSKLSIRLPSGNTYFFPSSIGLKQGCNLSPILFNLFINAIGDIFDQDQCQLPSILKLSLNHLLYADDLVLISETKNGLQQCLNKLQKYCEKNRITVNNKKTKVMIVQKRKSKIVPTNLYFAGRTRDFCNSYTYFGFVISNTGNFKININELSKSDGRAMYSLLGNTNKFLSGNIRILIDLFDKIILSICTYNCEVWGVSLFTMKFSQCDFLSEKQCKNPIDKLHLKFLKHILGVNQRATNGAVLSKTNRNSLITKVIDKMTGYWIHIKNSSSPIIQDVLELSNQLHREGKASWFKSITKIAEITGNRNDLVTTLKLKISSKFRKF